MRCCISCPEERETQYEPLPKDELKEICKSKHFFQDIHRESQEWEIGNIVQILSTYGCIVHWTVTDIIQGRFGREIIAMNRAGEEFHLFSEPGDHCAFAWRKTFYAAQDIWKVKVEDWQVFRVQELREPIGVIKVTPLHMPQVGQLLATRSGVRYWVARVDESWQRVTVGFEQRSRHGERNRHLRPLVASPA